MMHQHPCTDVRERLEAFYDGELAVDERIAIQNHLGECVACSLAAEELDALGASLRELAAQTADRTSDEPLRISARVLERLRVEEQFSLRSQVVALFQDMHLVWAGLGATVATMICVVGSASVLHAANQEQPGSFAQRDLDAGQPRFEREPDAPQLRDAGCAERRSRPLGVMASPIEMTEEEAEYALSAVVSREGRVQGVEVINQAAIDGPFGERDAERGLSRAVRAGAGARRRGGGEHGVAGREHHGEGPPRHRHGRRCAASCGRAPRRSRLARCRFPRKRLSRSRRPHRWSSRLVPRRRWRRRSRRATRELTNYE